MMMRNGLFGTNLLKFIITLRPLSAHSTHPRVPGHCRHQFSPWRNPCGDSGCSCTTGPQVLRHASRRTITSVGTRAGSCDFAQISTARQLGCQTEPSPPTAPNPYSSKNRGPRIKCALTHRVTQEYPWVTSTRFLFDSASQRPHMWFHSHRRIANASMRTWRMVLLGPVFLPSRQDV